MAEKRVRFDGVEDVSVATEVADAADTTGAADAPSTKSDSSGVSAASAALAALTMGAAPTPETEAKAQEFIEKIGATTEDREGLLSLQNLTLSMGLPAARACFRMMLDANDANAAVRDWAEREIAAFSPVTEVGCIQVDYFDRLSGRSAVARVLLDECPRDHDLGAEIAKLRPRVDDEKWVEVVKHISMLVHLGRSVYAQVAERSKPLIRRIYGRRADHACADEMKLGVDSRNTTLFVDPRWPVRIGIYIHAE